MKKMEIEEKNVANEHKIVSAGVHNVKADSISEITYGQTEKDGDDANGEMYRKHVVCVHRVTVHCGFYGFFSVRQSTKSAF